MIPVDFEPIENVGVVYDKQDCETNAAKRLLMRIKKNFKRLPICVSGDALYFTYPMIDLVEKNKWKYIFTFKDGRSKETAEYYNEDEYRDKVFSMISYTQKDKKGKVTNYFCYATNLKINEKNYKKIMVICRKWKIENKGFNELKNHGYHMKYAFSYHEHAIKIHVMIMLVSQMIMQLLERYEKSNGRFETIRKLGEDVKEALRNAILSAHDIRDIATRFYISKLISY